MGCCLIEFGHYDDALELFDKVLQLTLWERPMFNKGQVYLKIGNYAEALACFSRTLI